MINLSLKHMFSGKGAKRNGLPQYASIYFENLLGKYRSLDAATIPPTSRNKLEEIAAKRSDGTLAWDDLYAFDLLLARLLPKEELPRKVWSLRNRYRDVAGLREYDAYLASRPPDYLAVSSESGPRSSKDGLSSQVHEDTGAPPSTRDPGSPNPSSTGPETALRADIEFLLAQVHLRYALRPAWEGERDFVSRFVAGLTGVGLAWLMLYPLLLKLEIVREASTLTVVLFVGMMGGLVSIQQRYQSASDEGDPVHNIAVLRWGGFGVLVSPISGALFAGIFYIVFVAGLVQGSLFPAFAAKTENPLGLFAFFASATPTLMVDYAKLVVWSFIAGFFERMVPDTLSRFVAKQAMMGKGTA